MDASEGARFWLHVLTDLKNRGVQDIFFVCCDGLSGFPQAIETAFPRAIVQTCIVHMIRASLRYVPQRPKTVVALRGIYTADTEEAAAAALDAFDERWLKKYPSVSKLWRSRWNEFTPFLAFPKEIRTILYTTNVIESLNFQLRKVLRPKGHFPTDDSVSKSSSSPSNAPSSNGSPTNFWRRRSPTSPSCSKTVCPPEASYTENLTGPRRSLAQS